MRPDPDAQKIRDIGAEMRRGQCYQPPYAGIRPGFCTFAKIVVGQQPTHRMRHEDDIGPCGRIGRISSICFPNTNDCAIITTIDARL